MSSRSTSWFLANSGARRARRRGSPRRCDGPRAPRFALRLRHRQAAASSRRRVLAIEGPEGTDRMLRRVRRLNHSWLRGARREGGVLVKAAKRGRTCASTCRRSVREPWSRRPVRVWPVLPSGPARRSFSISRRRCGWPMASAFSWWPRTAVDGGSQCLSGAASGSSPGRNPAISSGRNSSAP